jgi:hypothetical protein
MKRGWLSRLGIILSFALLSSPVDDLQHVDPGWVPTKMGGVGSAGPLDDVIAERLPAYPPARGCCGVGGDMPTDEAGARQLGIFRSNSRQATSRLSCR